MIEDFFHLPPVVHLDLRRSPRFFEKFDTALMVYSGTWGKLIHEKTRSRKSCDTVPLKSQFAEFFKFLFTVIRTNRPTILLVLKMFG
jgi:hypothetical protein